MSGRAASSAGPTRGRRGRGLGRADDDRRRAGAQRRETARRTSRSSFREERETYAETLAASESLARALRAHGVARGDVVAVLMPNCPTFVHAFFACALLGARALLVNARYKTHELAYVLRNSNAVAVLTTDLVSEYVDFVPLLDAATRGRRARGSA